MCLLYARGNFTDILPEDNEDMNELQEQRLRYLNRMMGPERFENDFVRHNELDYRRVGMAFGIDPDTAPGDNDTYVHIFRRVLQLQAARRHKLSQHNTLEDAARLLGDASKVLVITGAGISTSLGIPDFRSKGTGFYSKLQELGFSEPEEVFDIESFDYDPTTFYTLAGDILPSFSRYTPTHAFIKLLQDHNKLQTNYTQNIDNLERLAGVTSDRLIQCHGSFATATCRTCGHRVPGQDIFDDIRAKQVSYCKHCEQLINRAKTERARAQRPVKKRSSRSYDYSSSEGSSEDDDIPVPGVMKPDITFFGEDLPDTFFERFNSIDKIAADYILVIGTSMQVAPVAKMPDKIAMVGRNNVPCVYVGREPCRHIEFDIQLIGDCDTVCWALADKLGWGLDHEMVPEGINVKVERMDEGNGSWWRIKRADVEKAEEVDGDASVVHSDSSGAAARLPPDRSDMVAEPGTPKG